MKRSTGCYVDGAWVPHFRWRGFHFPVAIRRRTADDPKKPGLNFKADVDKRTGHALYVIPGGERLTVNEIKEKFR